MNETGSGPAFPGLLEEMTVEDIRAFKPEVVVLPLGSTEPHGPHLPMGTDTYQRNAPVSPGCGRGQPKGGSHAALSDAADHQQRQFSQVLVFPANRHPHVDVCHRGHRHAV